jgi:hypothetical protein
MCGDDRAPASVLATHPLRMNGRGSLSRREMRRN